MAELLLESGLRMEMPNSSVRLKSEPSPQQEMGQEHGTVVGLVQVHQVSSISSEGKSRTGSPQFLHTRLRW